MGLVSSDHLEPGATASIKVTVDTTGRSGRLTKHIVVQSNDPLNPQLSLSLTAEVVP